MDEAYTNGAQARRRHGQSMDEWITYLKKVRLEVEAHDGAVVISNRLMASKLFRGAGLTTEKRAQVLFNCGGKYDPERMETVLRVTYPKLHETERKQGVVIPKERIIRNGVSSSREGSVKPRPEARKVHEVHSGDGEDVMGDAGDQESIATQAFEEDPGEEETEDDREPEGDEDQPEPEVYEAFLAGWKAKNKTAEVRKKRGFVKNPPGCTAGRPVRGAVSG